MEVESERSCVVAVADAYVIDVEVVVRSQGFGDLEIVGFGIRVLA